ncbi:MAG: hypothetical protein K9H26_10870 [Prolixibacteraceae bacterium]|nr:hypothetical protein [Prolixibacteraceae bacterium]
MSKRTLSIESLLKRDLNRAKAWVCEMMDIIPDFHPDTDFLDYLDNDNNQRFDEETAQILNEKLAETFELFSYHITGPGDDIYSFCLKYEEMKNQNNETIPVTNRSKNPKNYR